jgi:hypothetical protein
MSPSQSHKQTQDAMQHVYILSPRASSIYALQEFTCIPGYANVATFDAAEDKYNRTNCELTRELFASKAGVAVHYGCERGKFTE